jgi:predicted nuclease with TOPRIM domain
MGIHLSATAESSQTVVVSGTQTSFVGDGAALERDQVPEAAELEGTESKLREMQDLARAEMARRRQRLGNLTPDQELAVEKLLNSMVSRILEIVAALEL